MSLRCCGKNWFLDLNFLDLNLLLLYLWSLCLCFVVGNRARMVTIARQEVVLARSVAVAVLG